MGCAVTHGRALFLRIHVCLIGCVVSALVGCHAHVLLSAPPESAPIQQRQEAYARLRPLSLHQDGAVDPWNGRWLATSNIWLEGGMAVFYPEDLLPVVPPDSVTAKAARENRELRSWYDGLLSAASASAAASLVLLASTDQVDSTRGRVGTWLGISAIAVGFGSFFLFDAFFKESRSRAFNAYDESLRQGLGFDSRGNGDTDAAGAGESSR